MNELASWLVIYEHMFGLPASERERSTCNELVSSWGYYIVDDGMCLQQAMAHVLDGLDESPVFMRLHGLFGRPFIRSLADIARAVYLDR